MGLSMYVAQLGWEQWKLLRRVVKQDSKHRRGESQCQLNYKLVDNHGRKSTLKLREAPDSRWPRPRQVTRKSWKSGNSGVPLPIPNFIKLE